MYSKFSIWGSLHGFVCWSSSVGSHSWTKAACFSLTELSFAAGIICSHRCFVLSRLQSFFAKRWSSVFRLEHCVCDGNISSSAARREILGGWGEGRPICTQCVFLCVCVSGGRRTDIAAAALHQSTSCHQRADLEICPKCVCVAHWGGAFTCECVLMALIHGDKRTGRVQMWSFDLRFLQSGRLLQNKNTHSCYLTWRLCDQTLEFKLTERFKGKKVTHIQQPGQNK